ncbi:hypothetical protein [Mycobacterium marinum]|uniref:hypothetical protein n=1 Tax=Mycobacterium marinum TaxID=1781 RepID=UPI001595A6D4|nr:hypothetical protein [Mycobacterium marinum]MDC8985327.1 hypothetical protein [Mycobacterium marinum]MDC9002607.1 hypothetical protein [Mycobacterium marinum]MDC9013379.1 hypothetical protein [Mycobacterium marinum]MDC9018687.1 hypothetical protein [Mycobacterium marinum]
MLEPTSAQAAASPWWSLPAVWVVAVEPVEARVSSAMAGPAGLGGAGGGTADDGVAGSNGSPGLFFG